MKTAVIKKIKPLSKLMSKDDNTIHDNMVRMIVHEIRNPLSAVYLANQLLTQELAALAYPEIKETEKLTALIERNIVRIENQLKELMSTTEDSPLSYIPVNLVHLIDNVLEKAEDRMFLKKIKMNRLYRDDLFVTGNESKLSVAFLNLLVNAIEAIDHDKGELWISINDKHNEIEVIVRDNGKGMDPLTASIILNGHSSSHPQGRGFGLTHVVSILKSHNASVRVGTSPGKGTSFSVSFKK